MEKDEKIVYGDIEITQGSKFEQLELSILSLGMAKLLSDEAEKEEDYDAVKFHKEKISDSEQEIKAELKKLSFEDASKYLAARTQFWKNFDASKQNQFPSALNADKIPQTFATEQAQSFAKDLEAQRNKVL